MENNDIKSKNNSEDSEVDFDKLINSIPSGFNSETPAEQEIQSNNGYKTNSVFFHFLCIFGVALVSFFFVFQVYLTPISVYGLSMYPTINYSASANDDKTCTDVVYFREKNSYNRGDIVIFSNETNQYISSSSSSKQVNFLIKRVIACPGETIKFYFVKTDDSSPNIYYYDIEITDIYGNKVELNESEYINEPMYFDSHYRYSEGYGQIANAIQDPQIGYYEIKISSNCYFVMGDNRNNSTDSRYFGEININDICGNVRLHIKYGENIFVSIFKQIKSYFSNSFLQLKEYL